MQGERTRCASEHQFDSHQEWSPTFRWATRRGRSDFSTYRPWQTWDLWRPTTYQTCLKHRENKATRWIQNDEIEDQQTEHASAHKLSHTKVKSDLQLFDGPLGEDTQIVRLIGRNRREICEDDDILNLPETQRKTKPCAEFNTRNLKVNKSNMHQRINVTCVETSFELINETKLDYSRYWYYLKGQLLKITQLSIVTGDYMHQILSIQIHNQMTLVKSITQSKASEYKYWIYKQS